jgi:hypothetical protein
MEIMKQIRSTRTESFGDDEFQITNALLLITRTRSFWFWNVVRVQFKIVVLTLQRLVSHVALTILTRSKCLAVVFIHSRSAGHLCRAPLLSHTTVLLG